jgi:Kef-type K+ transport system membrane component KefB/voltage-gated potassium channel Kch
MCYLRGNKNASDNIHSPPTHPSQRHDTPLFSPHLTAGPIWPPLPQPSQPNSTHKRRASTVIVKAGGDPLLNLGNDFLLFLGATVLVVPLFKSAKQSPVLGYLFAGCIMGQLHVFRDPDDIQKLSELGVLFLLFEMGLELTFDKLKALAKYAFGLGTLQVVLCTLFFTAVALPAGNGLMTKFLEVVLHAPPSLVGIRTVDEAVVIAVALSLSSSAFVLQLLKERGELESKFGRATLGILLFQDIATVPFLVLLPLVEGGGGVAALGDGAVSTDVVGTMGVLAQLAPTALKTLGGIGLVLLGGRTIVRRLFELVAEARSSETFIALCLLSVTGAAVATERMGFSDTLGAFVAGVLLAETNFKAQVEADIQPFRGILLGLFFVTTGSSLDVTLFLKEWPIVITLLLGLLALKTTVISLTGPLFGLTKREAVRTAFSLSQGGEFAFVLLSLANELRVLPEELNRLLIIVVVLSMAATPALTEAGKRVAEMIPEDSDSAATKSMSDANREGLDANPVLICGFGDVGQAVANLLANLDTPVPYVAFDLTVNRVAAARNEGFNVLYGDGSSSKVLSAAGVSSPRAIVVGYTARQRVVTAVENLATAFPDIPILVRALDTRHAAEVQKAGASTIVTAESEAGLAVAARVATEAGAEVEDIVPLARALRRALTERAQDIAMQLEAEAEATAAGKNGGSDGEAGRKNGLNIKNGISLANIQDGNSSSSNSSSSRSKSKPPSAATNMALSVFKFDPAKAGYRDSATDDVLLSDTEIAEVEAAGPLGASVLSSIMGSRDGSRDSMDGSMDDGDGGNGNGGGRKVGDEGVMGQLTTLVPSQSIDNVAAGMPDGSEECPIEWTVEEDGWQKN